MLFLNWESKVILDRIALIESSSPLGKLQKL